MKKIFLSGKGVSTLLQQTKEWLFPLFSITEMLVCCAKQIHDAENSPNLQKKILSLLAQFLLSIPFIYILADP